jgi:hypothetical protein
MVRQAYEERRAVIATNNDLKMSFPSSWHHDASPRKSVRFLLCVFVFHTKKKNLDSSTATTTTRLGPKQ